MRISSYLNLFVALVLTAANEATAQESLHCGRDAAYVVLRSLDIPCQLDEITRLFPKDGISNARDVINAVESYGVNSRFAMVGRNRLAEVSAFVRDRTHTRAAIIAIPDRTEGKATLVPYHFAVIQDVNNDGIVVYDLDQDRQLLLPSWKVGAEEKFPIIFCEYKHAKARQLYFWTNAAINSPYLTLASLCALVGVFWSKFIWQLYQTILRSLTSGVWQRRYVAALSIVGVALIVGAGTWVAAVRTDGSVGLIIPNAVDVGEVFLGEAVPASISIRNDGSSVRKVSIEEISCRCLKVDPDSHEIQPHETKSFSIWVEATAEGSSTQYVKFRAESEAGEIQSYATSITYDSKANRNISPASINLGEFAGGISDYQEFELTCLGGLKPKGVIGVEIGEVSEESQGIFSCNIVNCQSDTAVRIRLTCDTAQNFGRFSIPVILRTESNRRLVCRVTGEIVRPFHIIENGCNLDENGILSVRCVGVRHREFVANCRLVLGASIVETTYEISEDFVTFKAAWNSDNLPQDISITNMAGIPLSNQIR